MAGFIHIGTETAPRLNGRGPIWRPSPPGSPNDFHAFSSALGQIGDPRFRRVLMLGIGLTFALAGGFYAGFLWLLQQPLGDTRPLPIDRRGSVDR